MLADLKMRVPFIALISLFAAAQNASAVPPFSGTIFLDPDVILPTDPTTYVDLEDAGQGERLMFDRRSGWVTLNAYLFNASYLGGREIEIQMNPEFESVELARVEAERFAPVIGRLPNALLRDVETVWVHKGDNPFGGGNNNLLIHTGMANNYISDGILEETLVHEASHTSLDADHAGASDWLSAQEGDAEFITTYARDNANREDIAETFLVWLAVRHRADRISETLKATIEATTPNRLDYFDQQDFDLFPIVIPDKPPELNQYWYDRTTREFQLGWDSQLSRSYAIETSSNLQDWEVFKPGIQSGGFSTQATDSLELESGKIFLRVKEE